MFHVQLSINLSDFETAVAFYSRLFGAEPTQLRTAYANFTIDDPPLKAGTELARQRTLRPDQRREPA
jgi:predicted enzyme related to lactoylglutathione lyase